MINNRSVVQYAFCLILALSSSGCFMKSKGEESADGAVSVAITSPSSAAQMDTTDTTVSLAGTASSDMGIAQVSWLNDRGGSGIANGTDAWQIAGIGLQLGSNRITVTGEDTAGDTTSRSIMVNRESGEMGSATLSWSAPTARTDGSPLTNLAGYRIYYGRMSGIYDYQIGISNPGILDYVVENLASGNWYFALAAYDSQGLESDRSNEVSRNIS